MSPNTARLLTVARRSTTAPRGTPATPSVSASASVSRRSSAGPRRSPTSVALASEGRRERSLPPTSWVPRTTCFEWRTSYPSLRARSARFGRGRPRAGGIAAEHGRGWAASLLLQSLERDPFPPETAVYHQPASVSSLLNTFQLVSRDTTSAPRRLRRRRRRGRSRGALRAPRGPPHR